MNRKTHTRRPSWQYAAVVFALMTLAAYFPRTQGWIPFPRDVVLQFPPWAGFQASGEFQRTANIGDLATSFYPFRKFAAESARSGTLPLWNPHLLAGTPFLASAQSALFYPLTAIYYVVSVPLAWALAIFIHMFLAAFFTWLFVKSIGGSQAGSIVAGMTFACCGFVIAWQGQAMNNAVIWLPLILYAVHRLRSDLSMRATALTAIAYAMPVLAGHPETALHVTLIGMAWALMLWAGRPNEGPANEGREGRLGSGFAVRVFVSGVLALGVASVQIFPTLEWLREFGNRLGSLWAPLPLSQAVGLVSRDIMRHPNSAGLEVPEAAAYAGMTGLLLVALSVFHERRRYAAFFALMTLGTLGIAYGVEPFRWFAEHVPILKSLKNWRLIGAANFGIAVLAGLGFSAIERTSSFVRTRKQWVFSLAVAALVLAFLLVYTLRSTTDISPEFMRRPSFSGALLFLGAIPIVWRLFGRFPTRIFSWAVCGIVAFDLITFAHGYTGFAHPNEIFPAAPFFDFLKGRADSFQFRMAQVGEPYLKNGTMVYGLQSGDGYEVSLERIRNFCWDFGAQGADGVSFVPERFFLQEDRRPDMLSLRYLVVATGAREFHQFAERPDRYSPVYNDGRLAVYENKRALPRAFAVPASGIEVIEGMAAQLDRMKESSFDPERMVVLSTALAGASGEGQVSPGRFESNVEIVEAGVNGYTFRTTTTAPSIMVVSQVYYPGWRAFVDRQETAVFDADYALTGFMVPEGTHDVRFSFEPRSFKIGLALSLVSCILLAGMITINRLRFPGADGHETQD